MAKRRRLTAIRPGRPQARATAGYERRIAPRSAHHRKRQPRPPGRFARGGHASRKSIHTLSVGRGPAEANARRLAGGRRARPSAALGPFTPAASCLAPRIAANPFRSRHERLCSCPRQVSQRLRRDLTWASTSKAGKSRFLRFFPAAPAHHPRLLPRGGGAKRFPAERIALNFCNQDRNQT